MVLAQTVDSVLNREGLLAALLLVGIWIVVGAVLTFLIRWAVRRAVKGVEFLRDKSPVGGIISPRQAQRYRTLRNVLVTTMTAVVWLVVVFGAANVLGINLTGLVVSASVVGAALGFGAQQVVRDILAGFFLIAEDQYGVGDVVDLGLASGTVEEVTLRVTKLRDLEGRVWYVPNGQIQRAANLTQEHAQVVLDVAVGRDADLDECSATLVAVAEEVGAQTGDLVGAPKVLGVQDIQDDRAVLRLVVPVGTGRQHDVGRELRGAVLRAVRDGRLPSFEPRYTIGPPTPPAA